MITAENLLEIKKYRSAALRTGKEWFVEYYIYNPELKKMSRKKIKLNHIEKASARREYASGLIRRLNIELEKGWNPFLEEPNSKSYSLLINAIDDFLKLSRKKFSEGEFRQETINGYESYMKILKEYIIREKAKKCMFIASTKISLSNSWIIFILIFSGKARQGIITWRQYGCFVHSWWIEII